MDIKIDAIETSNLEFFFRSSHKNQAHADVKDWLLLVSVSFEDVKDWLLLVSVSFEDVKDR